MATMFREFTKKWNELVLENNKRSTRDRKNFSRDKQPALENYIRGAEILFEGPQPMVKSNMCGAEDRERLFEGPQPTLNGFGQR
jgi:hypothetical protein